jgi:DNA (cytosine-5)-methyltransferase 1
LRYSKWISGEYWEEHKIAKAKQPIISETERLRIRKATDHGDLPSRWRTVRDAFVGLPDPRKDQGRGKFENHEFRAGAKPYPGHSGSVIDEPSKTLKAGAHGVPGGENMIVLDDGSLRYYTVRESARLQTFPDDYIFHGSWTESMRQIGNAVPVQLANIIGSSVFHQLERLNDYEKQRHSGYKAV